MNTQYKFAFIICILFLFVNTNMLFAQLQIEKSTTTSSLQLNPFSPEPVTFTITLHNPESCEIPFNLVDDLEDDLGGGFIYTPTISQLSATNGEVIQNNNHKVTWLDTLAPGESDTLIINSLFEYPFGYSGYFSYQNTATATYKYDCCATILSNGDPTDDAQCECYSILNDTIPENDTLCLGPCYFILNDSIPENDSTCVSICSIILNDSIPENDSLCILTPDTIYTVSDDTGFDMYICDSYCDAYFTYTDNQCTGEITTMPVFLGFGGDWIVDNQYINSDYNLGYTLSPGIHEICYISYDECGFFTCNHCEMITIPPAPPTSGDFEYYGCEGDGFSINVNGVIYDEGNPAGVETLIGANYLGCDSLVNINLQFYPITTGSEVFTGCEGDGYSVHVNGVTYNEANPTGVETIAGANQFGCDSIVTITLIFDPLPIVTSGTIIVCTDGDVGTSGDLTSVLGGDSGTGGYWTDNNGLGVSLADPTNVDFTGVPAGVYDFNYTIPSNTFCPDATAIVIVIVESAPVITIQNTSCSVDLTTYDVELIATSGTITTNLGTTVDNGGGSYTISGIPSFSPAIITATDASTGCSNTIPVYQDCQCPILNDPINDGNQTICDGDIIPSLSVTTDAGLSVNWYDSPSGGTILPNGIQTTTYTPTTAPIGNNSYYAEVIDPISNCTSNRIEVILIVNPNPIIDYITLNECDDDGDGFTTFTLTDADALVSVGQTGVTVTYYEQIGEANNGTNPLGLIYINTIANYQTIFTRVENDFTGCFTIGSLYLLVDPSLPFTIDITENSGITANNNQICVGDDATITASAAGLSYAWSDGISTTQAITVGPINTTDYTVTVTGINGCSSVETITLIVNQLPTPIVTVTETSGCIDNDGIIDIGDSALLEVPGVFDSYIWSNGSFNPSTSVSSGGEYTVTVSDTNGCIATASTTVVETNPVNSNCDAFFTYTLDPLTNTFTATAVSDGEWLGSSAGFSGFGSTYSAVLSPGNHDILHIVQDDCGTTCTFEVILTVGPIQNVSTPICSPLVPDICGDACSLGTLSNPTTCPSPGIVSDLFHLNNTGATAETPSTYLINCADGSNMPNPAADIWYTFIATANTTTINITGLNNPSVGVYEGSSCGTMIGRECGTAPAILSLTINSTNPGATYFLQISGGSMSSTGDFQLELISSWDCQDCLISSSITTNPPPINGQFNAGQTVEFCFTINSWNTTANNWIHSVVPIPGAGWDASTLTPTTTPASCNTPGFWDWYNSITGTNTTVGNPGTVGPGFAFESAQGNQPSVQDGNPGNNFGDSGDLTDCPLGVSWTFCWEITANECLPNSTNDDLSMAVMTYGDSETGSYGIASCENDPVTVSLSSIACDTANISCKYNLDTLEQDCNELADNLICLPLLTSNDISSGIIGMDYCVTYDSNLMIPTGNATLGSVVLDGNLNADYAINTANPGMVCISIFYTSAAPVGTTFFGNGEIACIEFQPTNNFLVDSTAIFGVENLIEGYELGISQECAEDGSVFYIGQDPLIECSVMYWDDSSLPLVYDTNNPSAHLITEIEGTDDNCSPTGSALSIFPDSYGHFQYNINNGSSISLSRDINNSTPVMATINGMDCHWMHLVTTLDPFFVPSPYQIIAMDVNMDGNVVAADVTHLQNRIILDIGEYPQVWNDGTSEPSKDWLFVDNTTINNSPDYIPSNTYPFNDGSGYHKLNVPQPQFCYEIPYVSDNSCLHLDSIAYHAILLGDIDKSWDTNLPYLRTKSEGNVVLNIDNAIIIEEECSMLFPITIENIDDVKALDFVMNYNSNKLSFDGYTHGTINNGTMEMAYNQIETGDILFSSYSKSPEGIENNNTIFYYAKFTILEDEGIINNNDISFQESYVDGILSGHTILGSEISCRNNLANEPYHLIYPNPFNGEFTIEIRGYPQETEFTLYFYDIAGKLIDTRKFLEIYEYQNEDLVKGVYLYELKMGDELIDIGKLISQ